jgi:DNA topoisomerase-3
MDKYKSYISESVERIKKDYESNRNIIKEKIKKYASGKMLDEYRKFDNWDTRIKCPVCGGSMETTQWGFKCIGGTDGKCNFTVSGDILGHRLLTDELSQLLKDGKCGPYYDFVSKKNKPFAAYLVWDAEKRKIGFTLTDMRWDETDMKCPRCGKKILNLGKFFKCEDYVDKENGCGFFIGTIAGKAINKKDIGDLLLNGETKLIKGFKSKDGKLFDAFIIFDDDKNIKFRFPEAAEMDTGLKCPICGGTVLEVGNGFKCENNKVSSLDGNDACHFFVGMILGHTVKKKELEEILMGRTTESVKFKNSEKKEFSAGMYWNHDEKRVCLKFDDYSPVETDIKCPICGGNVIKTHNAFRCIKDGCSFYVGTIAGVTLDEGQVKKLAEEGATDLIDGFKPREKGKPRYSAYLVWDNDERKISFRFPDYKDCLEPSGFKCPSCGGVLYKGKNRYFCDCGFSLNKVFSSVEIPEEQIKKLFTNGRTDVINGFFSPTKRKLFSARLAVDSTGKKVSFSFLDIHNKGGLL